MTNKIYPVGSIVKIVSWFPQRPVALFTGPVDDDKDCDMVYLPTGTDGLLVLECKEHLNRAGGLVTEYQVLYKEKIYWVSAKNVISTELKKNDK